MVRSVAPCASSGFDQEGGYAGEPEPADSDAGPVGDVGHGLIGRRKTLSVSTIGLGVEHLTKLAKPRVGGGQSRVHPGVKQDFGELVRAHPVTAGAAQVHS
jgi:hypothetical protein